MKLKSTTAIFLMLLILLVFLESCYLFPNNCKNEVYREFTDAEQNFFPYEVGDTVYYINKNDGEEHFLYCYKKYEYQRDTSVYLDQYCDNGGTTYIKSNSYANLRSNIIFKSQEKLNVDMYLTTTSSYFSLLTITCFNDIQDDIWLNVHPENGVLSGRDESNNYYTSLFFENMIINDKPYNNVSKIFIRNDIPGPWPAEVLVASIDTLYYSKTYGILKLVANEENLSLILK